MSPPSQSGRTQVKQSVRQDGHLCSAQQQPPREVLAAGRGDAAGHTRHVPGRCSHDQSQALAEQSLLPGMGSVFITSVSSSDFFLLFEMLLHITGKPKHIINDMHEHMQSRDHHPSLDLCRCSEWNRKTRMWSDL